MTVVEILKRLEHVRRSQDGWMAQCPAHDDRSPSLSIRTGEDGRILVHCHAGCTVEAACEALGIEMKDLFPELEKHPNRKQCAKSNGRGPRVAEYVYCDSNGLPVARKLRFEPGQDGRKKDFLWERCENGKWVDGLAGLKLPLYRLPEILKEPFIILVEGEKDADAGAKAGLPVATSGGINSFREDHADALRGRTVVIIADADDPGREYAQTVAARLYGKTAGLKVCEIPASKDLAEAIEKCVPVNVLRALFDETPEWEPAKGRELLDSVMRFTRRFVALTETQARVVALWTAHTHAMDAAECTPYLSINSAEKQSGKTRLLEVQDLLVANPWLTGRATAAVLVRKIDAESPTLLLDESDTAFGGEKEYAETLRGILNTGYKRGGTASCCVGQGGNFNYKDFATFCPKAIAGIGKLPDTVADRSISIRLKREPRGRVERLRKRDAEIEAAPIKAPLAAWLKTNIEPLRDSRPYTPESLSDRQADCCEPLLAIADLAGGDWPEATRRALVELCAEAEADDQSVGVRLLTDIRDVLAERGTDRIGSTELTEALAAIETSPWSEWSHGKPLTASKLARMLASFGIAPGTIRVEGKTPKGYYLRDFEDSFTRYIPSSNRNNATRPTNIEENADFQSATDGSCGGTENANSINKDMGCGVVAVSALPLVTGDGQARGR